MQLTIALPDTLLLLLLLILGCSYLLTSAVGLSGSPLAPRVAGLVHILCVSVYSTVSSSLR